MALTTRIADITRSPGDPRVLQTGPSSRGFPDSVALGLGYFSLGLGLLELFAPKQVTRFLGMEGKETLVRAYGVREIASGIASFAPSHRGGVWSRVAGDVLDIATLLLAYTDRNPRKSNVGLALAAVTGIALVDFAAAQSLTSTHRRNGAAKDYQHRSGWPRGRSYSHGAAKDFPTPSDMTASLARRSFEAAATGWAKAHRLTNSSFVRDHFIALCERA